MTPPTSQYLCQIVRTTKSYSKSCNTHPEHSNSIEGAVGRTIRLDHAKHAMKLPTNEEDNKEVMGVPETFKVSTAAFLYREEDHDAQSQCHDPAGNTGARSEVGSKERDDLLSRSRSGRVRSGKLCKIHHMSKNVNNGSDHNRPCCCFVEGNVLVKGNDVVQRGAAEE